MRDVLEDTRHEDQAPILTICTDSDGIAIQKSPDGEGDSYWLVAGVEDSFNATELDYPLTVIRWGAGD